MAHLDLLELLIVPTRPSEALLVPLVLKIWVTAGALGPHSKALRAPWIPQGPQVALLWRLVAHLGASGIISFPIYALQWVRDAER